MADDDRLVEAAKEGDRDALERLLTLHYDRVWAICRRLTGNDADAADATQEALLAITRGLPRFDARARFSTWVHRVAVNAALDELRRRRRRPEPAEQLDAGPPLAGGNQPQPESAAAAADVEAALLQLSPEFRAAVVLRDLCGLDYAEIAATLEIPPGTVRSRIARGRAALIPLLDAGNRTGAANRPMTEP